MPRNIKTRGATSFGVRLDQMLEGIGMDPAFTNPPAEGIVSHNPENDGDECFVNVHVGDQVENIGPCPYGLRGTALPKLGDRALIVWSELGEPWIVAWWPHA